MGQKGREGKSTRYENGGGDVRGEGGGGDGQVVRKLLCFAS